MNKIAAVLLLALSGMAADVSGTWTGTFSVAGSDYKEPQYFILKQDGKKLTGRGGPDAVEQYTIVNGKIENDFVTFELTSGSWKFKYALKTVGQEMNGTLRLKSKEGDTRTANVTLKLAHVAAAAGTAQVLIHIKLIDGRTGRPMKNEQVGLTQKMKPKGVGKFPDYRDISVRTDKFGIALLNISGDAVILVNNTEGYVHCGDERGGIIHNDFKVSEILSTGVVEAITQPNLCGKASGIPRPGELVLFVRPWEPGEKK